MAHGTLPGQRAPSGKSGRKRNACKRYRDRDSRRLNAMARHETAHKRRVRRRDAGILTSIERRRQRRHGIAQVVPIKKKEDTNV